jgi:phosphomannomutase
VKSILKWRIQATVQKIFDHYADQNPQVDRTDGVSLDFGAWRLNVRASNTEPLLRLNIESRADKIHNRCNIMLMN